jgi:hypothetical protein
LQQPNDSSSSPPQGNEDSPTNSSSIRENNKKQHRITRLVDINDLSFQVIVLLTSKDDTLSTETMEDIRDIVVNFSIACFYFGGDYLDGFDRMTAETFVNTYVENIANIGKLFEYDSKNSLWRVLPSNITKYMRYLTMKAYYNKCRIKPKDPKEEEEEEEDVPFPTDDECPSSTTPPRKQFNNKRGSPKSKKKAKETTKRMKISLEDSSKLLVKNLNRGVDYMTKTDFTHRVLRLMWYVNYVHSRDKNVLEPSSYGYKEVMVDDSLVWDFC